MTDGIPHPIPATAADFPRAFALAWGTRDAKGLSHLLIEDAGMLSLSGVWSEGRRAISDSFAAEFSGSFARSRLVTGKVALRPLGPAACILHQRFVLSGLVDAEARDLGRIAAMLTAVLVETAAGWQAASLQFSAIDG